MLAQMPASILRRGRGGEGDGGGAGDLADARAVVDVQLALALEHQRAFDHRVRSDRDARRALLAEIEVPPLVVRLLDVDAALDVRTDADGDVAAHGLDAAAQIGVDDADGAADRGEVAADGAAAADEDRAVDRFQVAGDACALAEADAAVDGVQAARLDRVAALDAAVDGAGVLDLRAVLQADAAVDGFQVAVGLAGFGGDAAVDLVDVLLRERGAGERKRGGKGEGESGSGHVRGPWSGMGWYMGCGRGARGLSVQLAPTGPSLQSAARLRDGSAALPSHAPKPVVLMILDGWGHRDDPADNALAQATLPHWRALLATCPHTLVHTEGRHVGLPDGPMGN